MLERGYLSLGRIRGIPLRMHVLTPLGALLFTGFRFEPGAWLGFLLVILLHELGHAFWVLRYRRRVLGIDLQPYGGVCHWSGETTGLQRSIIAWGGVMAQAIVLVVTFALVTLLGPPHDAFVADLVGVLITTNLWIMLINLVPFPPFDGAEAWKLVAELRQRWAERSRASAPRRTYIRVEPSQSRPHVSREEAIRIAKAFEDAVRKR